MNMLRLFHQDSIRAGQFEGVNVCDYEATFC